MKYFKVRMRIDDPSEERYWVIYEVATGKELPIKFHDWKFAMVEASEMNRMHKQIGKIHGKTQKEKYHNSEN